jgi:hypothetical protein
MKNKSQIKVWCVHMILSRSLLACLGIALSGFMSSAHAAPAKCTAFRDAMSKMVVDIKGEFVRPIVVSRGQGGQYNTWDLITNARIDGTLRCKDEVFVSFEIKISMPAEPSVTERFTLAQQNALMAAFGWPKARVETLSHRMSTEAAEYLRASAERGDVYIAGKVEAHEAGGVDLGLIWTNADRSFIILGAE